MSIVESLWDKEFFNGANGERMRILHQGEDYCLFYFIISGRVINHKHEKRNENYLVVDGEGILKVEGNKDLIVRKNHQFNIPSGVFHSLERISGKPFELIVGVEREYDPSDIVYC